MRHSLFTFHQAETSKMTQGKRFLMLLLMATMTSLFISTDCWSQSIAGGASHSIMLCSGGSILATGSTYATNSHYPVLVPNLSNITAVAAGVNHSHVLKNDGTVWGWGANTYGQLGDGTNMPRVSPVQVTGLSGITAISGGHDHSHAIKNDGTVWAWGRNDYGQLGDGTTTQRTTPVQVIGLSGITKVSDGYFQSMALKNDGTVWTWGAGPLGDGTMTQRLTPIQVYGLSGVYAISCGIGHFLALKSDGTVWAWGGNGNAQIGDGTSGNYRLFPVQVTSVSSITGIFAGSFYSLALRNDGTVWGWGYNGEGRLGDGTGINRSLPVQLSGISGVIEISGAKGGSNSLAMKNDGTFWGWGANWGGQLGDGTTTNRFAPVQMKIGPVPDIASLPPVTGTECYASISTVPTATLCGGATTIYGTTSDPLTYTIPGTYTVHWSYNDGYGNITTQNQTVIVQDVTPPVAVAHNITVELDPSGMATVTADQIDDGSYDNCGIYGMYIDYSNPAYFDCSKIGSNTVTFYVYDNAWNIATTSAIITVLDNSDPVITGQSSIEVDNSPGFCSAVVRIPVLKGDDAIFGTHWASGTIWTFNKSTFEVIHTSYMNIAGITQEITKTHGLSLHPITGNWYAVVGYEGTGGMVRSLVSIDPVSGNGVLIGETGINVAGIAFDNAGVLYAIGGASGPGANKLYTLNLSTGSPTYIMDVSAGGGKGFAYNPEDGLFYHKYYNSPNHGFEKINPTLHTTSNIPLWGCWPAQDITSMAYEGGGVFLMNGFYWYRITTSGEVSCVDVAPDYLKGLGFNTLPNAVRGTDNCGFTFAQTGGLPSGSLFPVGTTTNTYTATDASMNTATFSVAITVNDLEPPVITVPSTPIILTSSPNHYATYTVDLTPNQLVTSVTDNCTSNPEVTILRVDSDEPDDCGPKTNDIIIASNCKSVQLRKERCDAGNGRYYTIHLRATDASGNYSDATYQVVVKKGSQMIDDHVVNNCRQCGGLCKSVAISPDQKVLFLSQNFPNPFNPTTSITYGIPEDGSVLLRVFDVHGRVVSTLVNEARKAGTYSVEFDGSTLPSGVYLYRLEARGQVRVNTMTLIK